MKYYIEISRETTRAWQKEGPFNTDFEQIQ